MKIGIAADHGGFALKEKIINFLNLHGYEINDFGNHKYDKEDDYPDFVIPLARAISKKSISHGIVICSSGVGASIAANKIPNVRAALIHDYFSAYQGVEDDHMNVLCLGGQVIGTSSAIEYVRVFLNANFSGAERHMRRLKKVKQLEDNWANKNDHIF